MVNSDIANYCSAKQRWFITGLILETQDDAGRVLREKVRAQASGSMNTEKRFAESCLLTLSKDEASRIINALKNKTYDVAEEVLSKFFGW